MNLYEITEKYKYLLENMQINEETGELINADELEIAETEFAEKAEAYALFIKNLTADRNAMIEESKNLQERAKRIDAKIDRLKINLIEGMARIGKDKFETPKAVISITKSTETRIKDEKNLIGIPEDYIRIKPEVREADKTAIKKAIQAGYKIEGAELVENKNIKIK